MTLTLPTAGTVITAGLHSTNYTTLQTLLNGTLNDANIAAGGISLSKLAAAAWTAYTPAWTSTGVAPVVGNGSVAGKYTQIGKATIGRLLLTMGTTTTYGTGTYSFSIPVATTVATTVEPMGSAIIFDSSAGARYPHAPYSSTSTTVQLLSMAQPGVAVSPTTPVTLTTSDSIGIDFYYEGA